MRRIKQSSIHGVYCISRYLYQCYSNQLFFFFFFFFLGGGGGGLDSAVGRGDGQFNARRCCRGRELDSHGGS